MERDLEHVLAHTQDLWEPLRASNVFLTGGTGFVGTWLVESFAYANRKLKLGARMTVLSRNPPPASHSCVTYLRGDAASFSYPSGDYLFVIHASTEPQFEPTTGSPLGMFDADIQATRHLLEFARTHGARRFLVTSSGAVYGTQPSDVTHICEDHPSAPQSNHPASAYAQAKRVGEWMSIMYARQFGFASLIPRLFAFVGPHLPLDRNFAAGNFLRDVLKPAPIHIAGDGTPYRSYLYAADLAIWLWTILFRGESARPYNVGSPAALTIAQLANHTSRLVDPPASVIIAKQPLPGFPAARYVPCVLRAKDELGLRVSIPLDEALRRTYDWYRGR